MFCLTKHPRGWYQGPTVWTPAPASDISFKTRDYAEADFDAVLVWILEGDLLR